MSRREGYPMRIGATEGLLLPSSRPTRRGAPQESTHLSHGVVLSMTRRATCELVSQPQLGCRGMSQIMLFLSIGRAVLTGTGHGARMVACLVGLEFSRLRPNSVSLLQQAPLEGNPRAERRFAESGRKRSWKLVTACRRGGAVLMA
jgi:hypothetical protein